MLGNVPHRSESDEVAYVLLEYCTILIVDDSNNISKLPEATWIPIVSSSDADNASFERDTIFLQPPCYRGDLVLKPVQQASTTTMTTSNPILIAINHQNLAFDGTIADMCHPKGCCTARGNRSNAALLVSLVQTCQFTKHVQIESMQLLLRHIVGSNQNETKKEPYRRVAALLITFSIPSLDKAESESHNKHENMSIPLPPSVQLLFSLSRSDWDHLDHDINMRLRVPIALDDPSSYHLLDNGTLIQERVSLFPPKDSQSMTYTFAFKGLLIKNGNHLKHQPRSIS